MSTVPSSDCKETTDVCWRPSSDSPDEKELLQKVNVQDEKGNTPLCCAKDVDMIKLLLKNGACPFILNRQGKWPYEHYPILSPTRTFLLNQTLALTLEFGEMESHYDYCLFERLMKEGADGNFQPVSLPQRDSELGKFMASQLQRALNEEKM